MQETGTGSFPPAPVRATEGPASDGHATGLMVQARVQSQSSLLSLAGAGTGFLVGYQGPSYALGLGLGLARNRPALTPWLWGVNGATSVCASVLAVAIALSTTISTAFWVGCVCYLVALGAFVRQVKRVQARAEDPATTGGVVVQA